MRASHGLPAPSASLLRFLRCQLNVQSPTPCSSSKSNTIPSRQCRTFTSTAERSALRSYNNNAASTLAIRAPTSKPSSRRSSSNTKPCSISTQPHRSLSTTPVLREAFWRRLRRAPRATAAERFRDNGLLPFQDLLDDPSGVGGRNIKPSTELKLRCTEFDGSGNVVLVNGEFRKQELIAKYSLMPRDLRKIDSSVLPHILVRPSAIMINLLHIRCLIKHDRVLVFDVYGSTDSYAQSLFMYDLEGKLRQKQTSSTAGGALPYEFRALEAVLISVTAGLESEFEGVRDPVINVLRELEEDIDRDKLRHLLIYSKKLGTFEQKARLLRDAIEDLLEADDDLAAMYLTEKASGTEREEDNHEEVELILESYHKFADEIVQVSSNLVSSIKNTEEIIRAILDANRNSLMLLDLKFSILTLGTTVGMFIAALYGMNLENFIEETNYGFFGISGLCAALTIASSIWGLRRLRKVQRVSMWGESGSVRQARALGRQPGRGSWREIDSAAPGNGESRDARGGLGEAVAGIKDREAIKTWKREQADRLNEMKAARQKM
jgi:magnesium transporter